MAFSQAEAVRLSNENKIPAGTVVLAVFLTNGLEAAEARAGLAAARIAKIGFFRGRDLDRARHESGL
jgi:hypothetical protein